MKKQLLVTALITGLVLALGAGFANQESASHDVDIRIPNVLFLRITDGNDNNRFEAPAVNFIFTDTEEAVVAYLDHVGAIVNLDDAWRGSTDDTPAFGDVIVFSQVNWSVTVSAENDGAVVFPLDRVRVERGSGELDSSITTASESWTLAESESIFGGTSTQGWQSLGFSAANYEVYLDGSEDPGDSVIQVTYTIAAVE
ncbi:MAG: hypothetical protein EA416_14460 [Trueperaceae bacterium]|nr:MAG: hypothetical protein EA416_14460 [Trueperaceae bacterium]